ncbi:unnamed protein product [marine sediment metagenome]|uniref:Uncharacterized protein n=1 Tax=marine sediment metagenome TaxID=412755 RepID=X0YCM0_9ZZZZ
MESLFLFIVLLVALGIIALQQWLHYKEKEDIFTKFMARSLGEAEYFKKAYPKEVKEDIKKMEEERKIKLTPEEIAANRAAENL